MYRHKEDHLSATFVNVLFQLLNALQLFGTNLEDYLHLLLPPIVKMFDAIDIPVSVRK